MASTPRQSKLVSAVIALGLIIASMAAARPAAAADATVNVSISTLKITIPGIANINLPPGVHVPGLDRLLKPQRTVGVSVISPGTAPADATAAMDVPAGLGVGQTVTLGLQRPGNLDPGATNGALRKIQVYWGSGPAAGTGQPKVIDLSGDAVQRYLRMARPGAAGAADSTIASWPSAQGGPPQMLAENADPTGDYTLHTSFAGNASFHIGPDQTFLPALEVTPPGNVDLTAPVTVTWKPVAGALGYQVVGFGVDGNPQQADSKIVMWFAAKTLPFDAGRDLTAGDPADGVKNGLILPPDATSATIPAGIFNGLPIAAITVIALGPTKTVAGTPPVHISTRSIAVINLTGPRGLGGRGPGAP